MNLKMNIFDINNHFPYLDPMIQRYSITSPLNKDSDIWNDCKNRIMKIYGSDSTALGDDYIIDNPHKLSSYFSNFKFEPILDKIINVVSMQLYHAVMNLQSNLLSNDILLKNDIFKRKADYTNSDKEKTLPSKSLTDNKDSYVKTMEKNLENLKLYGFSTPFDDFLLYLYQSVFYNDKKKTSGSINALFPELLLFFRIYPKNIPGHYDSPPSFKYIDKLKGIFVGIQNDLDLTFEQNQLFHYEIDSWFGIERLYSSTEYFLDLIRNYSSDTQVKSIITNYGDCFKLLYELPVSLQKDYGPKLKEIIHKLNSQTYNRHVEEESKTEILQPLQSLLKEMIVVNILMTEISIFLAHNLYVQLLPPLNSFAHYDPQYIINKFQKILLPHIRKISYDFSPKSILELHDDKYDKTTKEKKRPLITPNFFDEYDKTIFSAIVPSFPFPTKRQNYLNRMMVKDTWNLRDSYINEILNYVIEQKQFAINI